MLKIFELNESNLPIICAEARLLEPFKKVISLDKTKEKTLALKELAFVYWYAVFDSPYDTYDEEEKYLKIKKEVGLDESWKITPEVKAAIQFFAELQQTRSFKYLESTRKAIENLSSYLDTVDVSEKIDSGAKKGELVHDINKVKALVKDMPDLVKSLHDIKAMVEEELKEKQMSNRAGRKTSKYNE